ncbi:hypothetical protein CARUB_v10028340mg, partial [Capsella rubella]
MSRSRITRFFKAATNATSSSAPPDGAGEWDSCLPPRIFATDRYPEFKKILESSLGSLFRFRISECHMSSKLVHALLYRQLQSKKKYEIWTVFGGYPLRFSLVEFGAVTGLSCAKFPEDYDPEYEPSPDSGDECFWDELIGPDRKTTLADVSRMFEDPSTNDPTKKLRLALLFIVDGVLIASSPTFPWGRESFLKTISTMRPDLKTLSQPLAKKPRLQSKQKSFRLQGFPLSLQLLAYRNISGLLDKIPGSADPRTFLDWHSVGIPKNNLALSDVLVLENSPMVSFLQSPLHVSLLTLVLNHVDTNFCSISGFLQLTVSPFIHIESQEEGWGEWDDEVKDKRICYMVSQIEQSHIFTKTEWPGGDTSLPLMSVSEKKDNVTHMKHVVPMRKQVSGKLRVNQNPANPNAESPCLSSDSNEKAFEVFSKFLRLRSNHIRHTSRLRKKPSIVSASSSDHKVKLDEGIVTSSSLPAEVNVRTPSPAQTKSPSNPLRSPGDLLLKGDHNWEQYMHNSPIEVRNK